MRGLATRSRDVMRGLLAQLANASAKNRKADEGEVKLMLHFIVDAKPRDQIELFLLAQMAIAYAMSMRYANYLVNSDSIPQQDSGERIFTKALRTDLMQMEALKRYRTLEMHALGVAREQPPEKQEARLAITDARAIPMEVLQKPEAAVVSIPSKRDENQ